MDDGYKNFSEKLAVENGILSAEIIKLKDANQSTEQKLKVAQTRILELERLLVQSGYKASNSKAPELDQTPLLDGFSQAAPQQEDTSEEEIASYKRKKRKAKGESDSGRKGLPEGLERREEIKHDVNLEDLDDYDPTKGYKIVDWDKSEELMYQPPAYWVRVHARPVVRYYSKSDGQARLASVGGPQKVFSRCMASPEVLAHIATFRQDAALTLYRIERWFKDHGCPLARSTLCTWMKNLGNLLAPIAAAMMYEIKSSFKIHTDDTNIRIQKKGEGKTVKHKVWVFIGETDGFRNIAFDTTENRTAEAVMQLLGGYSGYVQVDAAGPYDQFFKETEAIECGCWSHAFRKFEEICNVDRRALKTMKLIRRLCDVEEAASEFTDEQRHSLRQASSKYLLEDIKRHVASERELEILESTYKKALNYIDNQWEALTRFMEDGRIRIDNNLSEAQFHVLGVCRRNHLFWGSEDSLKAGLVLFSLIHTCRANGIDPYKYLCDVIKKVTHTQMTAKQLLPQNWNNLQTGNR